MEVGFIGAGNMGKAMALNLIKAGHRVHVWNRSPAPLDELRIQGAIIARNPRDAFRGDALLSMLADDATVRSVIVDGGVLPEGGTATIHVNMATISVAFAKELAALHAAVGVSYIAAPVFGRPDAAAAGKLHVLAAGDSAAIDRLQPLFDVIGQKTWRLGAHPSNANAAKIAGNLTVACAIEAIAEASALARAHGISAADLVDILTSTLFTGPVYRGYGDLIANRHYEPAGFRLTLGLKDVRLALSAGLGANVPLPFASVLRDNFVDAIAHGDGGKDWAAIAEVAVRRAALAASRPRKADGTQTTSASAMED